MGIADSVLPHFERVVALRPGSAALRPGVALISDPMPTTQIAVAKATASQDNAHIVIIMVVSLLSLYRKPLHPEAVHPRDPAEKKGHLIIINKYHYYYYYCQAEIVMTVRVEVRVEVRVRVEARVKVRMRVRARLIVRRCPQKPQVRMRPQSLQARTPRAAGGPSHVLAGKSDSKRLGSLLLLARKDEEGSREWRDL